MFQLTAENANPILSEMLGLSWKAATRRAAFAGGDWRQSGANLSVERSSPSAHQQ
jgi:hypothetical protein